MFISCNSSYEQNVVVDKYDITKVVSKDLTWTKICAICVTQLGMWIPTQ